MAKRLYVKEEAGLIPYDVMLAEEGAQLAQALEQTHEALEQAHQVLEQLDEALEGKVDAVPGKGLSANDYTDADKARVALIENLAAMKAADTKEFSTDNGWVTSFPLTVELFSVHFVVCSNGTSRLGIFVVTTSTANGGTAAVYTVHNSSMSVSISGLTVTFSGSGTFMGAALRLM